MIKTWNFTVVLVKEVNGLIVDVLTGNKLVSYQLLNSAVRPVPSKMERKNLEHSLLTVFLCQQIV